MYVCMYDYKGRHTEHYVWTVLEVSHTNYNMSTLCCLDLSALYSPQALYPLWVVCAVLGNAFVHVLQVLHVCVL